MIIVLDYPYTTNIAKANALSGDKFYNSDNKIPINGRQWIETTFKHDYQLMNWLASTGLLCNANNFLFVLNHVNVHVQSAKKTVVALYKEGEEGIPIAVQIEHFDRS